MNYPTNLTELLEFLRILFPTNEVRESIKSFDPKEDEIIIPSFAKCGTTWFQFIFHLFRTFCKDLNFTEISDEVPWIETCLLQKIDLKNFNQKGFLRGYKSHLRYEQIPNVQKCKCIVVFRDPLYSMLSMYNFLIDCFCSNEVQIKIEEFANEWTKGKFGNYYLHLLSWYKQINNDRVLLITYEHMIQDTEFILPIIQQFIDNKNDTHFSQKNFEENDIKDNEHMLTQVKYYSSLEYMTKNREKFDDGTLQKSLLGRVGLSKKENTKGKVNGNSENKNKLNKQTIDIINNAWTQNITGTLNNLKSYKEFELEIRKHLISKVKSK